MGLINRWVIRQRNGAAAERWLANNAERKATGCRCGRPATKVRYEYQVIGGVPAEIWTCDNHEGVNVWVSTDGGRTFEPGASCIG